MLFFKKVFDISGGLNSKYPTMSVSTITLVRLRAFFIRFGSCALETTMSTTRYENVRPRLRQQLNRRRRRTWSRGSIRTSAINATTRYWLVPPCTIRRGRVRRRAEYGVTSCLTARGPWNAPREHRLRRVDGGDLCLCVATRMSRGSESSRIVFNLILFYWSAYCISF